MDSAQKRAVKARIVRAYQRHERTESEWGAMKWFAEEVADMTESSLSRMLTEEPWGAKRVGKRTLACLRLIEEKLALMDEVESLRLRLEGMPV